MQLKVMRRMLARIWRPKTKLVVCSADDSRYAVEKAKEVLSSGGVLAMPTDTLYGLVTLLKHSSKLNKIKRRPNNKPFGLFIHSTEEIARYAVQTVPDELLKELFPGPVTLIFQRSDRLPVTFNPGANTVGFRIPMKKLVRELCALFPNMPLVQTSANVSGSDLSPLCVQDFKELWDDLDLIIDDGPVKDNHGSRSGSTIVDLSNRNYYRIVRDGCALDETVRTLTSFGLKPITSKQINTAELNKVCEESFLRRS